VLRRIGAWDPHNVTEDADLGMRLYRRGFRAQVLDSVTYEEAACQPGNWLRQRTRWLKGWLQTYGVHMRQPFRLLRELGLTGFLTFQGHFAGIIIAALVHPLSYVIILHDLASGLIFTRPETLIGQPIWAIAIFNLIVGYAASLALGYFVLRGRQLRFLRWQLLFLPVYWLLVSAAAYRAVYQLIKAPHYWEKTEHGLTTMRGKPERRIPR
jgi:glycosyltransferase XagB